MCVNRTQTRFTGSVNASGRNLPGKPFIKAGLPPCWKAKNVGGFGDDSQQPVSPELVGVIEKLVLRAQGLRSIYLARCGKMMHGIILEVIGSDDRNLFAKTRGNRLEHC